MILGVVIASEGRGTTDECEFENQIYRKKWMITPYKCRGGKTFKGRPNSKTQIKGKLTDLYPLRIIRL